MKYLPGYKDYNFDLQETAQELRKKQTRAEKHVWYDLFKNFPYKVYRQRPIGTCIVDFYIPRGKLVIGIDGEYHVSKEQREKDRLRDQALESLGYVVIRFSNGEVMNDLDWVKERILRYLE